MQQYSPLGPRSRGTLACVAVATSLALLSAVALMFDAEPVGWAGLEARLKQPEPPCPLVGAMPPQCRSNFASAPSTGRRSG